MLKTDISAIKAAYAAGGERSALLVIKRLWPGLTDHVARGALAQIMTMPDDRKPR